MSEIDLESKFPEMQPIRSKPWVGTIYGFGLRFCAARDHDPETGTFVLTHSVCALLIPLLHLRAFRVAATDRGLYLLGREPLSALAKLWNCLVAGAVLSVAAVAGWNSFTHSPDYLAGRKLAQADALAEAGKVVQAAGLYRDLALGGSRHAETAAARIRGLLNAAVTGDDPADTAVLFEIAVGLEQQHRWPGLAKELAAEGLALVERSADADPRGALDVLEAIAPLVEDPDEMLRRRRTLLESLVKRAPDDVQATSQLAVVYEASEEPKKCEALLEPLADRLGTTEAARILGQIRARQGKFDESYALLWPYCEERLARLHAAQKSYEEALTSVQKRAAGELENGEAPESFYRKHRNATEPERQQLIIDYVNTRINEDADVRASQEALLAEAAVVPVALNLGIVILERARTMADAQQQQEELRKAESTFLAIRGLAGDTDEFRLYLGQVYYWLGKPTEGRELFDALLDAKRRDVETLGAISNVLREVGAESEARELAEEAYNAAEDREKKQQAAAHRAIMAVDVDEKITWLRRADPAVPFVKAELSSALAQKALERGDDTEAIKQLRETVDTYRAMPESAMSLNNGAIAYFELARLAKDRKAFDTGMTMIERAVALNPSDSLTLGNAGQFLLSASLEDIIGDAMDLRILKVGGRLDLLAYLYRDQAGQEQYARRVAAHPGIAKAVSHLNKVLLLAPKRPTTYETLASIHTYTRDSKALEQLANRLDTVQLDLADSDRRYLDFYSGKDDATVRSSVETMIRQFEEAVQATRDGGGVTFAAASSLLVSAKMRGAMMGMPVEADELVRLAEEAHAAAPSQATYATLTAALAHRATETLAREQPAYAEMAARARRSLSPQSTLAIASSRSDALREAVASNPDVARITSLVLDQHQRFPEAPSPWSWAWLRGSHPAEAAQIAEAITHDDLGRTERAIDLRLAPLSASAAWESSWELQLAGQEADANALLEHTAERGVPMPFDLK